MSATSVKNGGHSCQNLPTLWGTPPQPRRKAVPTTIIKTKTCTSCKQTKPNAQFKRRLSIAQSRAVLRNPKINTPYIADSKLCKACQPKRKPPRLLSIKEIRTRVSNGDIHQVIGEMKIKEMREALPKRRAKVMREHWQKIKSEPINALKKHIQQQVAKFARRNNASKYLQDATKEQNSWNYEQAKRVRDMLVERIDNGGHVEPTIDIQTLFKPKQYNQGEEA